MPTTKRRVRTAADAYLPLRRIPAPYLRLSELTMDGLYLACVPEIAAEMPLGKSQLLAWCIGTLANLDTDAPAFVYDGERGVVALTELNELFEVLAEPVAMS